MGLHQLIYLTNFQQVNIKIKMYLFLPLFTDMFLSVLLLLFSYLHQVLKVFLILFLALIHQGYQNFLLTAYQTGKFTTVYPVARGFGPLVATVISIVFLGVYLKTFTIFSILLISAGVILIGLFSKSVIKNNKILYTSLTTGIFIGIYSVVDGQGARLSGSAISYMSWVFIFSALFFTIYFGFVNIRRFPTAINVGKAIFWIGGSISYLVYGVVIWGFTKAPIPMVSALRESSIIFAIFIGLII